MNKIRQYNRDLNLSSYCLLEDPRIEFFFFFLPNEVYQCAVIFWSKKLKVIFMTKLHKFLHSYIATYKPTMT